jgi:hypothetical protein
MIVVLVHGAHNSPLINASFFFLQLPVEDVSGSRIHKFLTDLEEESENIS